jgi:hypothetical protein
LERDEVTALASGVVQAKIVGVPSIRVKNGVVHIRVKSKIEVDTSILKRQIQEILKETGTLKKLEEERRRVKELEQELAGLKGSELKRLEELNAQALALERERERQRLFREEQALKARGELSKAEAERLVREREMQERINRTLVEQEKAKRAEVEALAKEQDRIRRAQLQNEQRWNELARKARLSQASWVPIDDSLSLNQAREEVKQLKDEIVKLNQRMKFEFKETEENLKKAYKKQIELTVLHLPPTPAEKDLFETSEEYQKRLSGYDRKVEHAKIQREKKIEDLQAEKSHKLQLANQDYIERRVVLLEPFVKRLQSIQGKKFSLPEERISVTLGPPDADHSQFPLELQYKDQRWKRFWKYTDRNKARDLWKTKAYLMAKGLFQLEGGKTIQPILTGCRVSHPGTGKFRDFVFEKPLEFSEIREWYKLLNVIVEAGNKPKVGDIVRVLSSGVPYNLRISPTVSSRVAVSVSSTNKLKIHEIRTVPGQISHYNWYLVETSTGTKGWVAEGWLMEKTGEKKLSNRFWDEEMKKHYRYDKLGNRVYE